MFWLLWVEGDKLLLVHIPDVFLKYFELSLRLKILNRNLNLIFDIETIALGLNLLAELASL